MAGVSQTGLPGREPRQDSFLRRQPAVITPALVDNRDAGLRCPSSQPGRRIIANLVVAEQLHLAHGAVNCLVAVSVDELLLRGSTLVRFLLQFLHYRRVIHHLL